MTKATIKDLLLYQAKCRQEEIAKHLSSWLIVRVYETAVAGDKHTTVGECADKVRVALDIISPAMILEGMEHAQKAVKKEGDNK